MKLGFSGTRQQLSLFQREQVERFILANNITEAHHGLCVGADHAFHCICYIANIPIIGHPPTSQHMCLPKHAWDRCQALRDPEPYLYRNRAIVRETDELLACPLTEQEIARSGTWTTIRWARRYNSRITIITPTRIYSEEPRTT